MNHLIPIVVADIVTAAEEFCGVLCRSAIKIRYHRPQEGMPLVRAFIIDLRIDSKNFLIPLQENIVEVTKLYQKVHAGILSNAHLEEVPFLILIGYNEGPGHIKTTRLDRHHPALENKETKVADLIQQVCENSSSLRKIINWSADIQPREYLQIRYHQKVGLMERRYVVDIRIPNPSGGIKAESISEVEALYIELEDGLKTINPTILIGYDEGDGRFKTTRLDKKNS